MKKLYWFHNADKEGCWFFSSEDSRLPEQCSYGPFESFSAAKQDALKYYQCDINTARNAVRQVKATRRDKPQGN